MKELSKSVSTNENPAKFVWQEKNNYPELPTPGELLERNKAAKKIHEDAVLTAADNGFAVKESKCSYETAKDLRSFIQQQPTANEAGVVYRFKDNQNIYNYAISTYDYKRRAGIGYVGYSVKVDENSPLTDAEIYSILENNLNFACFQNYPNTETMQTGETVSINSVEKNNLSSEYDTETNA